MSQPIRATSTITHNGPQELKIELSRFFEYKGEAKYFVSYQVDDGEVPQFKYLHSDGILKFSALDNSGNPTGWYHTLDKAEQAIRKYVELKEQSESPTSDSSQRDSLSEVKAAE
jgi:hypothetical protein